ncbi:MAG: DEDD exonuclease domain-containing protein [Acidimicrobiia bacterium]
MTALPGLQRSFDDLGTPLHDVTFCVVDLETTGGSAAGCEITEVGAVKVRGGVVLGEFQTLVDPGTAIPPTITLLTGITQAMVCSAPRIEGVLPSFLEFAGDAVLVGHNVRFDLSFLDAAAIRLGYGRLPNRTVDTVALARRLVRSEVRDLRLQTLAAHLRSPVSPSHRALDDARATVHVLHGLLERAGSLGVTALEDLLQLPTARGSAHYAKIDLARRLPREPGVYLFTGRGGEILYVGKAKNLRNRVTSYFHGDPRRRIQDLLRETQAVDHRVCASELEAQITELRLIHAHRPRYNRASRPPRATHWVTLTREAFPRLTVARTLHRDRPFVLGPFRSKQSADLVVAAIWDAVQVRRCSGPPGRRDGPCGFAQMGTALCPCDGTLEPGRYAAVVDRLVAGVEHDPDLLLDPIEERMRLLAQQRRFEEAGWMRDRHRALGRALERRRRWLALSGAGRIEAESSRGERVVLDGGRLLAAWRVGEPTPFLPPPGPPEDAPAPPGADVAEEVDLLWSWLISGEVQLVDLTGPMAWPARPVPTLRAAS